MKHVITLTDLPRKVPSESMTDGAFCGNGDLAVIWGGYSHRIVLHICKADFWNSDGNAKRTPLGGISPLGSAEILLPFFHDVPYHVEQDIDRGVLTGYYERNGLDARLTVAVAATENTVLIELDRAFPGISSSIKLCPLNENGACTELSSLGDITLCTRSFDTPEVRFPSHCALALKEIDRIRDGGRERIRYAITVCTNHDTAAYKDQVVEEILALDGRRFDTLLSLHAVWWREFWKKSGVRLSDEVLEKYWYLGLYVMACCARNTKFPPGLWGNLATKDGMLWQGDYHLNYNFEAPYYHLVSSNHPELIEGYTSPLNEFIPKARRYARDFFGCRGVIYPVGIGPLGHETDIWPDTKEHGHLFLGQRSNAAYAAVIPMMHWYGTRDTEFALKHYYGFLREVADFWEDYLTERDGSYHIKNDALYEASFWSDFKIKDDDECDTVISLGLVKMLMKLLADIATALDTDSDKIPKWRDIAERIALPEIFEKDGVTVLRGKGGNDNLYGHVLQYLYPTGEGGKHTCPEIFNALKNSFELLQDWNNPNQFCSVYPAAARLGINPDVITENIHKIINTHGLKNGLFEFPGGGIENSAAIPATVNEMLLQSYDNVLHLFPTWNKENDASFFGLRAFGAFLVDAELKNGIISASVHSEKGGILKIAELGKGYVLLYRGQTLKLEGGITEIETHPHETVYVKNVLPSFTKNIDRRKSNATI